MRKLYITLISMLAVITTAAQNENITTSWAHLFEACPPTMGSDMVLDGETGLVSEPTVEAYSAALARLMSDSGLRTKMGESARAFCAERYSREGILAQWERLLARVAGE